MAPTVIDRPVAPFDGASHTYRLEGWADEDVAGVSSVAKVGGFEETWGIASAWGFRIGYEGAVEVANDLPYPFTPDEMRTELKARGLTPWSKRDQAAERGTWVHDVLEALAQDGDVPALNTFPEEVRGHVLSVLGWYIRFRPTFVATEVQVASRTHGFAGRYDIRAHVPAWRLVDLFAGHDSPQAERVRGLAAAEASGAHLSALCLIDLKTSKGVYPTTHFPQLSGYELASVEMGFPATDCQLVLNSHADGSPADFVPSWSQPQDFLAFLGAFRAARRIQREDPEEKLREQRMTAILAHLPARSRELAERLPELRGLDGKAVGILLSKLKKRGCARQVGRGIWEAV